MTEQEMWATFTAARPEYKNAVYEAWCYGSDAPDKLAALTLEGVKTATASAYPFYEYEKSPLPAPGDLSLILSSCGTAVCIIETTHVETVPFNEVTERQAFLEGEGDRSLAYWRRVHEECFTEELKEIDAKFSQDMLVVCEEFEKLFPQ